MSEDTITCPTCNVVTDYYEYGEDAAYCVACWEKMECFSGCGEANENCDCQRCESCEEKVPSDEIYEGRCSSCEDAQMVRSIR